MNGNEGSVGATPHPDWWNSKLHAVMIAISAIAVVQGLGYLPDVFRLTWALILPHIAFGVYLDGKKVWRAHHG